jgi:hypothetical protein
VCRIPSQVYAYTVSYPHPCLYCEPVCLQDTLKALTPPQVSAYTVRIEKLRNPRGTSTVRYHTKCMSSHSGSPLWGTDSLRTHWCYTICGIPTYTVPVRTRSDTNVQYIYCVCMAILYICRSSVCAACTVCTLRICTNDM